GPNVHDEGVAACLGLGVNQVANVAQNIFGHAPGLHFELLVGGALEEMGILLDLLYLQQLFLRRAFAPIALVVGDGLVLGAFGEPFVLSIGFRIVVEYSLFPLLKVGGLIIHLRLGLFGLPVILKDSLHVDDANL